MATVWFGIQEYNRLQGQDEDFRALQTIEMNNSSGSTDWTECVTMIQVALEAAELATAACP